MSDGRKEPARGGGKDGQGGVREGGAGGEARAGGKGPRRGGGQTRAGCQAVKLGPEKNTATFNLNSKQQQVTFSKLCFTSTSYHNRTYNLPQYNI